MTIGRSLAPNAQQGARANDHGWHFGSGAASGASRGRGSSVTFGKITPMLRLAIALQIVHLLYNQVATLCDLFPFNGVRFYSKKERLTEAAWNGAIMVFPVIGYLSGVPLLMEMGLLCLLVLLGGEVATWWIPYFFGASPKWVEIYSRVHSQTITPLPRRGANPVPNLEHLILMVLTLITTVCSFAVYQALNGLSFPYWWILAPIGVVLTSGVVMQCCVTPKEPNKALQPTTTSVTTPAAQESRRP